MNKRAVFLDRDGVLNELVYNKATKEYEAPHSTGDVQIFPYVIPCLKALKDAGYSLFIVTNQPDYAKGKVELMMLSSINRYFKRFFAAMGVPIEEYYCCFHHPEGVIKSHSFDCECRKPKPFFLIMAEKKFNLDLSKSWMVGDRTVDIQCGKAAGVKTVLIKYPKTRDDDRDCDSDYMAWDLKGATDIIINSRLHMQQ